MLRKTLSGSARIPRFDLGLVVQNYVQQGIMDFQLSVARLLPARRKRPRGCRAAEKRDELAASHSITSSASNCRELGTSRPSALAVCRLITNSNLVDCKTGRSAGFAPLRI